MSGSGNEDIIHDPSLGLEMQSLKQRLDNLERGRQYYPKTLVFAEHLPRNSDGGFDITESSITDLGTARIPLSAFHLHFDFTLNAGTDILAFLGLYVSLDNWETQSVVKTWSVSSITGTATHVGSVSIEELLPNQRAEFGKILGVRLSVRNLDDKVGTVTFNVPWLLRPGPYGS